MTAVDDPLEAIGFVLPNPLVVMRAPSAAPCFSRYALTASARLSESAMLYFSLPTLSVCPTTKTSAGFSRRIDFASAGTCTRDSSVSSLESQRQ